jgi:hypothetical protein
MSAESERRLFGDLVVLPMRDTYENLTLKSLAMAVYAAHCGRATFYAKADDDVFIFPWRLARFLEKVSADFVMYKRALGVYIGTFWVNAPPILAHGNKNYEGGYVVQTGNATAPATMPRGKHYTPYAGGPFYILARAAVVWLGAQARDLNWRWRNEDMAMGNMLVGADIEFVECGSGRARGAGRWRRRSAGCSPSPLPSQFSTFLIKVLHWKWSQGDLIALHNIDDR